MATSRQIAANRRNAQKSVGPKTAEGREIVSRNAITHGLTAARAVVLPEEQEEFDRPAAALYDEWLLQGPTERFHLDRMIHGAWRLRRLVRMETRVLLALCQKEAEFPAQDDPAMLGRAYIAGHGVLTNLSRHERHVERSLREAQHELELALYVRDCEPVQDGLGKPPRFRSVRPCCKTKPMSRKPHHTSDIGGPSFLRIPEWLSGRIGFAPVFLLYYQDANA